MKWKIFLTFIFCIIGGVNISYASDPIFFKGNIDFEEKKCQVLFDLKERGQVSLTLENAVDQKIDALLNFDHLKTPFFDLSSDVVAHLQWSQEQGQKFPSFVGSLSSEYSLIDYKPIEELSGQFELRNKRLYLKDFSLGGVSSYGYIDFHVPYSVDFILGLMDVDLNHFLNFWVRNKDFDAQGTISGQIKVLGTLNQLFLEAKLESYDGLVEKLAYDEMLLNLGGIYPQMRIAPSSTISQKDGASFSLEGVFDLAKQEDFQKQIKDLVISPIVTHSGSDSRWTIRRSKKESSRMTQTNYLLKKGEKKSSLFDRDPDILGIEKTLDF